VVNRGKFFKQIELEYSFDRLSGERIIQAYQILVPEKIWKTGFTKECLEEEKGGGTGHEFGSDLCASVLGSTKRRTHNC
jgi:hypothetical protein